MNSGTCFIPMTLTMPEYNAIAAKTFKRGKNQPNDIDVDIKMLCLPQSSFLFPK